MKSRSDEAEKVTKDITTKLICEFQIVDEGKK